MLLSRLNLVSSCPVDQGIKEIVFSFHIAYLIYNASPRDAKITTARELRPLHYSYWPALYLKIKEVIQNLRPKEFFSLNTREPKRLIRRHIQSSDTIKEREFCLLVIQCVKVFISVTEFIFICLVSWLL